MKLYDEFRGDHSSSIIHDTDIRDVINELFGSGAKDPGRSAPCCHFGGALQRILIGSRQVD